MKEIDFFFLGGTHVIFSLLMFIKKLPWLRASASIPPDRYIISCWNMLLFDSPFWFKHFILCLLLQMWFPPTSIPTEKRRKIEHATESSNRLCRKRSPAVFGGIVENHLSRFARPSTGRVGIKKQNNLSWVNTKTPMILQPLDWTLWDAGFLSHTWGVMGLTKPGGKK